VSESNRPDAMRDAAVALDEGDVAKAAAIIRSEIPNLPEGVARFNAELTLAVCHARRREWANVVATLGPLAERNPQSAMVRAYLGAARFELGQIDIAREDLDTAVRIDPDSALPYIKRGEYMLRLGLLRQAQADLKRGVELPVPDAATREYTRHLLVQVRQDIAGSIERHPTSPARLWQRIRGQRPVPAPKPAPSTDGSLAWID
jgi:tetratricopeptide (TPR) repeat protein